MILYARIATYKLESVYSAKTDFSLKMANVKRAKGFASSVQVSNNARYVTKIMRPWVMMVFASAKKSLTGLMTDFYRINANVALISWI